jgi:hypothetical protein
MAASWFALITAYLLPSSPSGKTSFELLFFGGNDAFMTHLLSFPLTTLERIASLLSL